MEKPASSRQPKAPRPDYNIVHALPLPLKIYPLPAFFPHNPLSIICFIYGYVSQAVFHPSSHPTTKYKGLFSSETGSIHVTDSSTTRALWEAGFFGKGNLSRSEPTWFERDQKRKGALAGGTSEDATRRRREERKEFKNERARKERDALNERLEAEGKVTSVLNGQYGNDEITLNGDARSSVSKLEGWDQKSPLQREVLRTEQMSRQGNSADETLLGIQHSFDTRTVSSRAPNSELDDTNSKPLISSLRSDQLLRYRNESGDDITNQEHLQLTLEEAFFLSYALGILDIIDEKTQECIPISSMFSLFRSHSYFPPCSPSRIQPDDQFILSYVVYHHFRSLGWVVRSGIKFAVDYLLYNRGPVFTHAEFAIIIIPSYSNCYWSATTLRKLEIARKEKQAWWWLHCVNRVQSQVQKSLILVFVDVPPPPQDYRTAGGVDMSDQALGVGDLLKQYKIRELSVKRWIPNRSRD